MWFRHALAILLLPFMAAVVLPWWLLSTQPHGYDPTTSLLAWVLRIAGVLLLGGGIMLVGWCIMLFARIGHGTLAPWDETRNLVTAGPYRFVRNPMISGVAFTLAGEALLWGSWAIGAWLCVFVLVNHVYFVLLEEPGLEQRFGESYRIYMKQVPRWIPHLARR